jgi:hypothetical protein
MCCLSLSSGTERFAEFRYSIICRGIVLEASAHDLASRYR